MTKILINGSKGRMGCAIATVAADCGCQVVGAVDMGENPADFIEACDVVIDFSFRDVTLPLAELCVKHNKPLVIGTTGHSAEQRVALIECSKKIPIVWAGNYSLGVNLLNYLTRIAATILDDSYDVEIVEMHHRHKKDAPSGTAQKLKEVVLEARKIGENSVIYGREGMIGERPVGEVSVHALRGGSVVGDHTVMFAADGERVELTHKAADRKVFSKGALTAAKWLCGKPAGLYGMEDVLNLK